MNRDKQKLMVIAVAIVAVVMVFAAVFLTQSSQKDVVRQESDSSASSELPNMVLEDTDWKNTISYNGVTYERNRDLQTILFLGVDDTQAVDAGGSVGNNGRADAIFLLILNKAENTAQMLKISRDTITDVDVYNKSGKLVFTGDMQLNMQYAFGESNTKSCWLMKQKVSELMYEYPIDGYIALTIEGISKVVNQLGGLTFTLPEDCTDLDPSYVEGAEITVYGDSAEHFVRYRDTDVLGSAETRAKRQTWFIRALFQKIMAKGSLTELVTELQEAAGDTLTTDLDVSLAKSLTGCTLAEETLEVPGEVKAGTLHDEFYVDEEALRALIVETFYVPVS
jgi:LCP family protein required for cell wall assembly